MKRGGAMGGQGGAVAGAGVALVGVEAVVGVVNGCGSHEPVAGDLGQDGGGGDGQTGGVAFDQRPGLAVAHKIPLTVHQHRVGV